MIPGVMQGLSASQLDARYPEAIHGKSITTRQFLIHLLAHLNYHLGQVDYLRRITTGKGAIDLAGSVECPRRSVCVVCLLASSLPSRSTTPAAAQLENVGQLSFPTSGSAEAQRHFLRGVAILHSFGWKQAIAEFQLAQKAQPDFAMAYWGETLCYNHPLNSQMDSQGTARRAGAAGRRIAPRASPRRRPIARRASSTRSRSCGARATRGSAASPT